MTEIDFYILDQQPGKSRLNFACRLAEKAVGRNLEILINTATEADCKHLDELLWTFSQGSFLPHRTLIDADGSDQGEPIVIGCGHEPQNERWDLMINLAAEVPEFFSQFHRVAELVDSAEDVRAAGRERFRYYRDRGYELRTHHI